MAAIPVTLNGVFTTDTGSVTGVFQGTLAYSGLGVGGGPIQPPSIWPSPGHPAHPIAPGGPPPGIWPGPGDPDFPGGGGGSPPSIWPGRPEHPIVIPPEQVPPEAQPPQVPPPGTVTPVPPPEGSAGWPTTGMVPPPYVVMQYPGFGPVYVTAPPHAEPAGHR